MEETDKAGGGVGVEGEHWRADPHTPASGDTRRRDAGPCEGAQQQRRQRDNPKLEGGLLLPRNRPESKSGSIPVMILPQVHLRKPCYDFYFL